MPTEAPAAAEKRACPACGGELQPWRAATASDPQLAGASIYPLERCARCGTATTLLHGTPSPRLYEHGAYAVARPLADRLFAPLRRLIERDKLRFLRGLPPGARVVEIGAGDGSFIAAMRAAGLDARGYEPSERGVSAATRRGLPVVRAAVDELDPGSGLDAVVAWHVLEHLAEPQAALARAHDWLRPGGRAVVACPNLASVQARIAGDRWFHQDVPRHRTHFTADGLERLLERCGFRVERTAHLLVEQNPLGMWLALLNRLTRGRDVPFRLVKGASPRKLGLRDFALTLVLGPPLAVAAVALELGAALVGRGGSMVIVAGRAA